MANQNLNIDGKRGILTELENQYPYVEETGDSVELGSNVKVLVKGTQLLKIGTRNVVQRQPQPEYYVIVNLGKKMGPWSNFQGDGLGRDRIYYPNQGDYDIWKLFDESYFGSFSDLEEPSQKQFVFSRATSGYDSTQSFCLVNVIVNTDGSYTIGQNGINGYGEQYFIDIMDDYYNNL